MNLVLQQLPESVKGSARAKMLAPDAAVKFLTLDPHFTYSNIWHDATSTLLARRMKMSGHLPGYDPHNYGLAITFDKNAGMPHGYRLMAAEMRDRGFYCHRQDSDGSHKPGAYTFYYLGDGAGEYSKLATQDPLSWDKPIERKIYDLYSKDFALSPAQVQSHLLALGFFHGTVDGNNDAYLREGIMAFQRAYQLEETGNMTPRLQRALAFVGANISIKT